MRDFKDELETKLRLERTHFGRKKLELEMELNELEMLHQLRERERELQRKLQTTTLEKDDVRSQSSKSLDNSPLNWISKKKDVSEWANTMSETKTPSRPKTRSNFSPDRSEDSHYSQNLSSRDCSASVEDRNVLHKVAMRTDIGNSSSSSLPKLNCIVLTETHWRGLNGLPCLSQH